MVTTGMWGMNVYLEGLVIGDGDRDGRCEAICTNI